MSGVNKPIKGVNVGLIGSLRFMGQHVSGFRVMELRRLEQINKWFNMPRFIYFVLLGLVG
ncbi:hypothetical protein HanIR_Chr08g0364021 [Helianthus annuus]|nr:hypothetical protein HanIR_Chr08g0364021 [Helianthus annuus]